LYSWWDDDMSGETDTLAINETTHNSIRYQYENGAFAAGISVDDLVVDGDTGRVGAAAGEAVAVSLESDVLEVLEARGDRPLVVDL
ncbi:porin, partial [Rhizobium leguminosarum]|uniref:porin n=1 Tax=Rhizobium leguminosarum TaxID=384 RepID=UPI003F973F0C